MNAIQIIFYLLAGVAVSSALVAVAGKKILRATIFLLFSLTSIAGLYFMMDYFFIAAVQIIVYIGGIVVLIIFAVLLTHRMDHELVAPPLNKMLVSLIAVGSGATLCLYTIWNTHFPRASGNEHPVDMTAIGNLMLSTGKNGFILPFEVISILLLAAMIAAIVIAKRQKKAGHD